MGFNSEFKGLIAQHVSGDTPPIIRSSKTVNTASGFTYVFGCRQPKNYNYKNYNRECAYTNGFPILVKGLVVSMRQIFAANSSICFGRKNFAWMGVWVLKQACLWLLG
jgi:hypothetical protein